ncbi:serine/threonine protein kinase [Elasticomyces elasticus]|nr:serine/threonine protein kinase [Elasticomyces elasticus]
MPPKQENSKLKRARVSSISNLQPRELSDITDLTVAENTVGEGDTEAKKPRRSNRISSQREDDEGPSGLKQSHLPSPVTRKASTSTDDVKAGTVSPPHGRPSQIQHHTPEPSPRAGPGLSSPPDDTQPYSQFVHPPSAFSWEVKDEEGEGVWGYLVPVDNGMDTLVLRRRGACPVPQTRVNRTDGRQRVDKKEYRKQEEEYEEEKATDGVPAGGYLIGRHPECDRIIEQPTVSNRHCLLFNENKDGDMIAVLEDLSGNGTFVNEAIVGRNKRRELHDGDEIAILDQARFVFRYPRKHGANGFRQQYVIQEQLGKGHFAAVYLCIERCTGLRYAVKKFEKRTGPGERSKVDGLQQEIAVLMSVSHPNMLCLKDTFDEPDGVYLILELAPEGELFNLIVMKQKLTEVETRKIFVQLFQGVKYLTQHERNIVHRDIKPENILLIDKELHVKLADFGLAKIIGEESFTTTLCGTPSYVAPEILEQSNRRRYTRAVDVWSLGVVLYICLCGFPPFSDELYSPENPHTLSEQIKLGRFDYPSPYWDAVGDPALDLIDRMLTVDVEERISIDECLEHPWTTVRELGGGGNGNVNVNDSTDGLASAIGNLDFSRRKVRRERTLLSSINDVKVSRVIDVQPDVQPVKVFEKNLGLLEEREREREQQQQQQKEMEVGSANGKNENGKEDGKEKETEMENGMEPRPADKRDPQEFMELGGRGDQQLFGGDDADSVYPDLGNSTVADASAGGGGV